MRTIIVLSIALAAALSAPVSAQAARPTLDPLTVVVTPQERSVTANWSLPPNMRGFFVEMASASDTYPDGDSQGQFLTENLIESMPVFLDNRTTQKFTVGPGPLWVHVAAYDPTACVSPYVPTCLKEFSASRTAEIPPTSAPGLISVGNSSRHLTAEWWRSPWHVNDFIEVATSPEVYASGPLEGLFLEENLILYDDTLTPDQKTYVSDVALPAGTHYVHVGTHDVSGCCPIAISPPKPLAIPATPPVLRSVSHQDGFLHADWSLPTGMRTDFVEVATSPAVYQSGPLAGFFLDENLILFDDFLGSAQVSYDADVALPRGVYYVHMAGLPVAACPTVDALTCVDEFSEVLRLAIPNEAAFAAPPATAGAVSDSSTAFASLSVPGRMSARNLVVRAVMGEKGTVSANGTVSVPGSSKVYRLTTASASAAPGKPVKLRLKLSKKALKSVRKALRRHRRVVAKLTITARDLSGNAAVQKRTVRLKR